MTKFIKSVAAAAVLATSATGAHAQASLSTDVDVTLPSVIALYCFDSVSVTVGAAGLQAALELSEGANAGGTLGATTADSLTAELDATSEATVTEDLAGSVDLNLNNVCAFRALVEDGVTVSVAESATPTLVNGDDSINAAGITLDGTETSEEITAGLGLGVAATGVSVVVPLDLTNATSPGEYSRTDLFTITVAAL